MDGYFSKASLAARIPDFVSCILAAWTTTASRFPMVSTTMCRLRSFVFSLYQFCVLPRVRRFLRFASRWLRSWGLRFALRLSVPVPPVPQSEADFHPKSASDCGVIKIGHSRGTDFATCSRYLQSTTLHPPIQAFPICYCFQLAGTVAPWVPIGGRLNHSHTGLSFFCIICSLYYFFPYWYSIWLPHWTRLFTRFIIVFYIYIVLNYQNISPNPKKFQLTSGCLQARWCRQ